MAELFQRNKSTISRYIKNILESGELQRNSVVAENATTAADSKTYAVSYYNLDMIICVGYRVNSHRGVQFRYHIMSHNACNFNRLSTQHRLTLRVKSKKRVGITQQRKPSPRVFGSGGSPLAASARQRLAPTVTTTRNHRSDINEMSDR